ATVTERAADRRNTDLVLALGGSQARSGAAWTGRLVGSLVGARQYAKARAVWARVAGAPVASGIFDPGFTDSAAPPPFNWVLTSSTVGLAERRNGLHVIFYGQEDGVLASQLLLLAPGTYRLAMPVSGDAGHSGALVWTVTCANSNTSVARFRLDPKPAAQGWSFTVPANCPAQKLELSGVSSDMPQQTDVTIGTLRLDRLDG